MIRLGRRVRHPPARPPVMLLDAQQHSNGEIIIRLRTTATATAIAIVSALLGASAAPALAETADAVVATPATYYVNCGVKSAGSGLTDAAAWNSLAAVNAHGAFAPGDRILFKRGTTCRGRLAPSGSGTRSKPIVVGAYGSSKSLPTVAGGGTGNVTGAVQLTNVQYWTVQDLHVTNAGSGKETSAYRSGVFVLNQGAGRLRGIVIRRLQIDHVVSNLSFKAGNAREYGGIAVWTLGKKSDGFDDLQLMDNKIDRVGRTGIAVVNHEYPKGADQRVRIGGNSVTRARGDSILLFGSKNARIDHNVSAHGADLWPCAQCGKITPLTANAGIWPAASNGVRIDHNEIYGEHQKGGDGEGIDVDHSAVNVVVEYNYVHDNEGGGILFCGSVNAVARFNILENNAKSAFAFIGSIPTKTKTSIYNNTVYNSSKSKARVVRYFNGAHSAPISFKNNLLYNYSYASYLWPTKKVSTASNTLVGLHSTGRPADSRTSYVDPGLKKPGSGGTGIGSLKGYRPKHPSSFKRGVAIPTSVKVDFFGKKINPKAPPRGAAG